MLTPDPPTPMALFDTHVHLCDPGFDGDRQAVLDSAFSSGIAAVMEIGDSPHDWDKVIALSEAHPGRVHASLGFHPHFAQDWRPEVEQGLRDRAGRFRAVGEIGLDYVRSLAGPAEQMKAFRSMLALAVALGKPVVIHCREAFADLFPVLGEWAPELAKGGVPGVIHCFSGGPEEAARAVGMGFLLGVDGPVTYPKNEALRKAIAGAGLDALVLETDSPYLPPQRFRGQRNEPARLDEVALKVSEVLGVPREEVAQRTTANARRLFRLG